MTEKVKEQSTKFQGFNLFKYNSEMGNVPENCTIEEKVSYKVKV